MSIGGAGVFCGSLCPTAQQRLSQRSTYRAAKGDNGVVPIAERVGGSAMKAVMCALIALWVMASLVAPAGSAWNPDEFWAEPQYKLP